MMALSNQVVNLYSDLLIHGMGPGLTDDILQGRAAGDEFRTAPLWGLSQRIFFLHDGRTTDLNQAIIAHRSAANAQLQATPHLNPYGVRFARLRAKFAWSAAPLKKMPEQNSAVFDVGRIELMLYGTSGVRRSPSCAAHNRHAAATRTSSGKGEGDQRRKQ